MKKKKQPSERLTWRQSMALNIRAFRLLWKERPEQFVSIALCSAVKALSPYATVYLSARLVDELAGARDMRRLMTLAALTVGVTAALGILKAVLERWRNREYAFHNWLQPNSIYDRKLMDLDYPDMDSRRTHALHAQIQQNGNWASWGLGYIAPLFEDIVEALCAVLGAVALCAGLFGSPVPESAGTLAVLNHPLMIAAVCLLFLGATLLPPVFSGKADEAWNNFASGATLGNRIFSFFGFTMPKEQDRAADIRIYRQDTLCNHYMRVDNSFGANSPIAKAYRGKSGIWSLLGAAAGKTVIGLAYLYTCLKAWAGAFGVGSVTQYIGAITALSAGIAGLLETGNTMRANGEYLKTTFEFMDIPNKMYQGSLTTEKRADRQYAVEFRDVSFRYPDSEVWALRHVNMKFRVGRRLAVVGENGSGKTTFIKLLCRLYDPTEGQILLNGIDIRKYRYDDYMAIFSVVFQDFRLLAAPLGQNVAAGMDYDRARAEDCLRKAGFGERLSAMPKGLDTPLYKELEEDGVLVSGGEAQKIAIARALYKDAPFIILDEPTAALDPVAEAEIYSKFDQIAGDKTAIYISHRLSSCKFCDEIAVFQSGAVIQQGTHAALLADERGEYYALWNAQAQYYTEKTGA